MSLRFIFHLHSVFHSLDHFTLWQYDQNCNFANIQIAHPGILDLSSDVVEVDTNGHHTNGTSKRYPMNYKPQDAGASPIMTSNMSSSLRQKQMTSFSPIVIAADHQDAVHSMNGFNGQIAHSRDHEKHSSFVLESDVDYYSQVQQMNDVSVVGSMSSRARVGTISYAQNPAILDDEDEEEDVEYDYGSQMDREMTQTSRLSSR